MTDINDFPLADQIAAVYSSEGAPLEDAAEVRCFIYEDCTVVRGTFWVDGDGEDLCKAKAYAAAKKLYVDRKQFDALNIWNSIDFHYDPDAGFRTVSFICSNTDDGEFVDPMGRW